MARPKHLFDTKASLILCAVALLIAFTVNASFGKQPLLEIAKQGEAFHIQLFLGALIGTTIALLMQGALAVGVRYFKGISALEEQMFALLARVNLTGWHPLWIGACAGLWEEVFFRATLQPLIGPIWAALIFTLAHTVTGQFWKMNLKKLIYAAFVFLAGLFLGFVFERIGLIAAIATHAMIDIVALYAVRGKMLART
jgi:uncharacterized protein